MEIHEYLKGIFISESQGMFGRDVFIPFWTDVIITIDGREPFETVIYDLELSSDEEMDDILHFKGGSIGMSFVKFIEDKN